MFVIAFFFNIHYKPGGNAIVGDSSCYKVTYQTKKLCEVNCILKL